jgi:3-dehydroquinate dehydratase II
MPTRVMVLNGPNLNLLGVREPHIYGSTTLAQIEANCHAFAKTAGMTIDFHQSNHEGQIIDWVQAARETADAIVINPAGYTFTSVALMDALKMFKGPIFEVHITNIHAREATYHHSKVSPIAKAVICGLGAYGYLAALQGLAELQKV